MRMALRRACAAEATAASASAPVSDAVQWRMLATISTRKGHVTFPFRVLDGRAGLRQPPRPRAGRGGPASPEDSPSRGRAFFSRRLLLASEPFGAAAVVSARSKWQDQN
jgi:hypothetical protein